MRQTLLATAVLCLFATALHAQAPVKRRVAVVPLEFAAPSGGEYNGDAIAAALTDRINVGITDLGRFEVIERARLSDIMKEQALGQTGAIDEATAAKVGELTGVELVIVGSITSYTVVYRESSDGKGSYKADMTLGVRFVDASTGEIKKAKEISAGSGDAAYEKAEAEAQGKAVRKIIQEIRFLYPLQASVARVDGKFVYLTLGANMGLKEGMRFRTVNEGKEILDPNTGAVLGTEKEETGVIKIVSVDESFSKAQVLKEKGDIGVGDNVYEMKATTRIGITVGYSAIGLTGAARSVYEPIQYWVDSATQIVDTMDLDAEAVPAVGHWVTVGLDISEIRNTSLATQLQFMIMPQAGELWAWMVDWNFSWNFPVIVERLHIPVGAGLALGQFYYNHPYADELEANYGDSREWSLQVADSEDALAAGTWGFYGFAGLRVRIAKHLDAYVHGGYRFNFISSPWEVTYRTGARTASGEDATEKFTVEDRFMPYEDVAIRGFDVRAGITVAF